MDLAKTVQLISYEVAVLEQKLVTITTLAYLFLNHVAIQAVPLHVEAATGSKRVEAVQDPVTGHLDTVNWKDKIMLKTEKFQVFSQKQPVKLS